MHISKTTSLGVIGAAGLFIRVSVIDALTTGVHHLRFISEGLSPRRNTHQNLGIKNVLDYC